MFNKYSENIKKLLGEELSNNARIKFFRDYIGKKLNNSRKTEYKLCGVSRKHRLYCPSTSE
ncbi:MAG: hypothetical protein ACE5KE_08665 [Methanosarcinales archaeon]